jgi:hypothetical protein
MLKEGNKVYSILQFKCPKCHKGELYPTQLSEFKKVFHMYDRCPACDQPYVIEPGFYWGAMYIAYMLSSGIILGGFGILFFGFGMEILPAFGVLLVVVGLLYGFIFRMARSIWINLYVHYDPKRPIKNSYTEQDENN